MTTSLPPSETPDLIDSDVLDSINWVFGYGSLMWNPGFAHDRAVPARLDGFERSFCIYSHHYRGTPECPGLVLGLDKGQHCRGVALRFRDQDRRDVISYLNERELIGYAYQPKIVDITTEDGPVRAYTFIADQTHGQYAGNLGLEETAKLIMTAEGQGGLNRDYLMNTVSQLEAHGFHDADLHALLQRVQHLTGLVDQGGGI